MLKQQNYKIKITKTKLQTALKNLIFCATTILCLILLFFIIKYIFEKLSGSVKGLVNNNSDPIIEGLEGNSKKAKQTSSQDKKDKESSKPEKIRESTQNILDSLAIDENRRDYEDTIIETNKWVDSKILETIVNNTDDSKRFNIDNIHKINNLRQFKETLNGSMKYLDGIKTQGAMGLW